MPISNTRCAAFIISLLTLGTVSVVQSQEPAIRIATPRLEIPPVEQVRPGPAVESLGFDRLAALALGNNPTLVQAAAAIGQEQATQVQVGLYPNPQLGYLRTDPSVANQSRTDGVFVGQEFVTAGKRWKSRAVEGQEIARLRWEYQAQERRVLNDLRIRYFEVLAAQKSLSVIDELIHVADEGLKNAEQLRKGGQAAETDVLQARIQVKTMRARRVAAETRANAAWHQLVNIIGYPQLAPAPVDGSLEGGIPSLDWQECWERLLAESPQLRAAETRVGHARSELERERAQRIPNVTVQVIAQRDYTFGYNTVSTLVALPTPIFNRNQGNIAHAQADIREAHAEVRRTQLVLRDQLTDAFRRYDTSRRQVEQLQQEILPDVETNLKLVTAAYRGGEMSMLQVLSAQEAYANGRLALFESLADLRKTQTEIDGLLLTGGLNPAAVGTALQAQGANTPRQGILNQLREENSRQALPPAFQAVGP